MDGCIYCQEEIRARIETAKILDKIKYRLTHEVNELRLCLYDPQYPDREPNIKMALHRIENITTAIA